MRAYLPAYELRVPKDLDEALGQLGSEPGAWKPFAGGTDLMVLLQFGQLAHQRFVSIWNLRELRGIQMTADHVTLGALTTYTEVQGSDVLRQEFPLLCRAAAETGGLAIQNRGTLGGNIVNASPAADSPPALLVYDAELELVSASGSRRVPYRNFHTGYRTTILGAQELVARIRLPRATRGWRHYYRKVGTRRAQAISKVCFAGAAHLDRGRILDARIALGSVAPTVVRCTRTESVLKDQALTRDVLERAGLELAAEIRPIDDFRSTARYRQRVAVHLLEDFLSGDRTDTRG